MKIMTKLAIAGLIMALTACTNPDRFGGEGGNMDPNANAAVTQPPLTGANDPSSPQYFSQTIGDRVLFVIDTSTLTDEGKRTLDGQAQWLQTNSDYRAIVEGHADEQGTREYNLALGARRANAVREYLISKGVASGRLQTISYGKERPIEICASESCYRLNRRAVTIISAGAIS